LLQISETDAAVLVACVVDRGLGIHGDQRGARCNVAVSYAVLSGGSRVTIRLLGVFFPVVEVGGIFDVLF
jgi:hypothetical protein